MGFRDPNQENMELRQLLAFMYAGTMLYSDDGELQDNRKHPFIDFKRDDVSVIQASMIERAKASMDEPQKAMVLRPVLTDWLNIAHDNELSLGDRLQRLSVMIQSVCRGEDQSKYKPHEIRQQCGCAQFAVPSQHVPKALTRQMDEALEKRSLHLTNQALWDEVLEASPKY